jgi:hypothetical protein
MDTQISSGLNKNIIIGIVVLAVAASAMLIVSRLQNYSSAPVPGENGGFVGEDLSELNALSSDIDSLGQNNILFEEIDGALNELGEVVETSGLSAEESNLDSLSKDLSDISGDEAILKELDQALGEAAF